MGLNLRKVGIMQLLRWMLYRKLNKKQNGSIWDFHDKVIKMSQSRCLTWELSLLICFSRFSWTCSKVRILPSTTSAVPASPRTGLVGVCAFLDSQAQKDAVCFPSILTKQVFPSPNPSLKQVKHRPQKQI